MLLVLTITRASAQDLVLSKGAILENITIGDSIQESINLYLPTSFENSSTWPVLFVFDLEGKTRQAMAMFLQAAEREGYILASSNQVSDTIAVADNILIANRMINWVNEYLPVQQNRSYTAGFATGAKIAATIATVVPRISGLVMIGASLPNVELLYKRKNFHFVGIVGNEDFNLLDMQNTLRLLNSNKYPNQLIVFKGEHTWPSGTELNTALRYLTLSAMAKGNAPSSSTSIAQWYSDEIKIIKDLIAEGEALRAHDRIEQVISAFRLHRSTDSLQAVKKEFRKRKDFKTQRRAQSAVRFKESLIREDYAYYLEEDVITANFNNLGWWNYQMAELKKYEEGNNREEQHMAVRLKGYLNALVEDHIDIIKEAAKPERDALMFTWMLKTITAPEDYEPYLSIISESARIEDYGTALFYLEELLKNGYKDKDYLYKLEHSALFRITPEFNKVIAKYFKDPRYDPGEQ